MHAAVPSPRLLDRLRRRDPRLGTPPSRYRSGPDRCSPAGASTSCRPRLGIAFAFMLFAMFLGAMNYANNLALGLTFLLGSLGLTAMHYCHRNLAGVRIRSAASEPVFAGEIARFRIALENTRRLARHELTVAQRTTARPQPARIDPDGRGDARGRVAGAAARPARARSFRDLDAPSRSDCFARGRTCT